MHIYIYTNRYNDKRELKGGLLFQTEDAVGFLKAFSSDATSFQWELVAEKLSIQ